MDNLLANLTSAQLKATRTACILEVWAEGNERLRDSERCLLP
jgi:hypothetical protein